MSNAHSWTDQQVNLFARRFADSKLASAWWAFPVEVRSALVTEFVMLIAFGSDSEDRPVQLADAFALVNAVSARLATHHKLGTERV